MKYTAINIGPIVSTLGMARKPGELWAASYLFSHLMKCIYQAADKRGLDIISPAKPENDKSEVGLYPDRIFIKGTFDAEEVLHDALGVFFKDLSENDPTNNLPDLNYFNLMTTFCDEEKESLAIGSLNHQLDVLELCNYAKENNAMETIYKIISKEGNASLYKFATGEKLSFESIEEIAKVGQSHDNKKSHFRYFCVVQADGDNIGKTISNKGLEDGNAKTISKELVKFGSTATNLIKNFGGLPIYAGGDDLLFIAPVIGKDGSHIFNLLDDLENVAFKEVHDLVGKLNLEDDEGKVIEASLSFGVSITYHKYPLYEALETARKLLFEKAKDIKEKKAIAWSLRKHSGGTFEATFSRKNSNLWSQFIDLIKATTDDETVSAIAQKIRQEEALVDVVLESDNQKDRLDALFEKVLEFDNSKKAYFDAVKAIMPTLYKMAGRKEIDNEGNEKDDKENPFTKALYCLLRTAKFIKGEDLHDE